VRERQFAGFKIDAVERRCKKLRRHPEVLAALGGEPRRISHRRQRPQPSFETPRKRAAPQDDAEYAVALRDYYPQPAQMPPSTVKITPEV
jgi:hypothetical protein